MDNFQMVIGIDLDNTLAIYDDLIHRVAYERDLIDVDVRKSKRDVRAAIRRLPDGEIHWQRLQGVIYGPRMAGAKIEQSAKKFIRHGNEIKVKFRIVSHRTELANYDETKTNLRGAALEWMESQGFFDPTGLDLEMGDVYFESTRHDKIERIKALGCTHFIDDLEEVFAEEHFPEGTMKILYGSSAPFKLPEGVVLATSWSEVERLIFGASTQDGD